MLGIVRAIDFRKDKTYKATTKPQIVDIPEMQFVVVDGEGAPEGSEQDVTTFQRAMQTIFGIVFTIKFWSKKYSPPAGYIPFTIAPVEGLWWTKSGKGFDSKNPHDWKWTIMLRLPDFVTETFFKEVVKECANKKQNAMYHRARLEKFKEGKSVQILHIGPYDQESKDIEKMQAYATTQGYKIIGKHHELYFGDPRRTAPEKLRTILRQAVQRV